MPSSPVSRAYGSRFVKFQLAKYAAGLALLGGLLTLFAGKHALESGRLVPVAGALVGTIGLAAAAVVGFRQYRCPACEKGLQFAHGNSVTGGPSSRADRCPFCGAELLGA